MIVIEVRLASNKYLISLASEQIKRETTFASAISLFQLSASSTGLMVVATIPHPIIHRFYYAIVHRFQWQPSLLRAVLSL